jgi:flagellin
MAVAAAGVTTESGLETELNNKINGAMALVGEDPDGVSVDVKSVVNGANVHFETTFTGADGKAVVLGANTDNFLASLGITPGTYNASGTGGKFQVGADFGETIDVAISDIRTGAAGLNIAAVDVSTAGGILTAIQSIDAAITEVSELRGKLGAIQNRFEHTIANLSVTVENLSASESRIRDTDMAEEMMAFTRAQILQQAGTAMLAQANAVPQSVLQLLQ